MENRIFEAYGEGLEQRIISAAYGIEQRRSLFAMIQDAFRELHIMKPQYALSFMFAAGLCLSILFFGEMQASDDILSDFYISGEML